MQKTKDITWYRAYKTLRNAVTQTIQLAKRKFFMRGACASKTLLKTCKAMLRTWTNKKALYTLAKPQYYRSKNVG